MQNRVCRPSGSDERRLYYYVLNPGETLLQGTGQKLVNSGGGIGSEVSARVAVDVPRFYSRGGEDSDTVEIVGESRIESHFPLYMNDQGL